VTTGHCPSSRHTDGKQALTVTVDVGLSGMSYVQHEALLPQEEQVLLKMTFVQKQGMLAGMG
jgi:hypothetical protein